MLTSLELYPQPYAKRDVLLKEYEGKHVSSLPTPSFVIQKSVIQDNCARMIQRAIDLKVKFRGHVKTVKTYQGLRYQMGYDLPKDLPKQDRVLVSTLNEAWQIIKNQEDRDETIVNDLLFGLPVATEEYLLPLFEISKKIKNLRLMVDNVQHLQNIKDFNLKYNTGYKWSVFIKIDAGTNRAGILVDNDAPLAQFLEKLFSPEIASDVELYGIYCHSGHSYASDTIGKLELALIDEISHATKAVDILKKHYPDYLKDHSVNVSVGATPSIHSFDNYLYRKENTELDLKLAAEISKAKAQNIELEIHAGNYPVCDLQQLATGCIEESNVASYVVSTVVSQYPGRRNEIGELLMSTGVISMSKEVSTFKGYGAVRYLLGEDYGDWYVDRLSQEHGILSPLSSDAKLIPIGTKIKVLPQHSCITINAFSHIFLVEDEKVVDVWIPWRGY